jgi:hypothetical protein
LGEGSQNAIDNGYTSRLIEEFQILGLVQQGCITMLVEVNIAQQELL